ncbi:oocyte zinc finger protein XlCOF7.1-like isoform X2 [Eleutherodactylus coqui]|uniref:oocyte zinc finger protein XlCOF7.1-like isoform X2 n=1 Tax=Eleutherodactylus coqui TaxID=57060 RepID=UPI003462F1C3
MDTKQSDPTELVLNLTLEMVLLLTREDYFVVKKPEGRATSSSLQLVEGSWGGLTDGHIPLPQSGIHEPQNKQKILDLTNKIIELLTGEVPIRCQDVAVFFSEEEWDYIEEHKETYNVMTENHRTLTSPGLPKGSRTEYPSMRIKEEQYEENVANPDIYIPTESMQQNPVYEEAVSCDGGNLIETTQQYPFTHIKEEPVSCNIGTLTNRNLYTATGIHTQQYAHTSIKEEPRSCHGRDFKGHRNTPHDEPQPYLPTHIKDEPGLQDGESLPDPHVYAEQCSPGVNVEPVSSRGNLICNAHLPSAHAKEGLPHPTSPETPSRANDGINIQFSCSECKKCFLSMAELVSHQGLHIAEKLLQSGTHVFTTAIVHAPQVPPVKHKLLTCSKCERTFYTKSSLVGHMKTHWGKVNHLKNETFKCDQCGKCFSSKSLLHVHSRLHFGDRPYACSTCGERFMRNSGLGRHQRKHQ